MKAKSFLALIIIIFAASADTTIVNAALNYTIYLPDNWVLEVESDSQHFYYDSTWTFESQLSLMRHTRNAADYPTAEEWTRAHFIAYKLVADYSASPWGTILYYDSSATSRQDNLWAPELYSTYHSVDTAVGSWSEYIRFTASGGYGYDLYAIGDTTDMLTNVATYAAILQGIDLPGGSPIRHVALARPYVTMRRALQPVRFLDALGRTMPKSIAFARHRATGLYMAFGHKPVLDIR